MKKVKLFEEYIQEATTSWGKMMKGVRAGEGGPWTIVAIEGNKVVGQQIVPVKEVLPAVFEGMRKQFPRAKFHIEDSTGGVVWNESLNEALAATDSKKLTNKETLTPAVYKKLFNDARNGVLKMMKQPDGIIHFWNPTTKEYVAKVTTYNGKGEYFYSDLIDADGNLTESFVNEAKDATREELMNLMETKYGIKSVSPSEDFDGQTEGIWIAADNEEELSGNKIFDYYNKSAKYKNGVLKTVVDAVEKMGWWFSWNDPGTMMCWPKN